MAVVMAAFRMGVGQPLPCSVEDPALLGHRLGSRLEGRCRGGGSGLWTTAPVMVPRALMLGPKSLSRASCGGSSVSGHGLTAPVPHRLGCAELQQ